MSPCRACGAENPEGARFCMACGTDLAARCPACGAESPPGARFCIACGSALAAASPIDPAAGVGAGARERAGGYTPPEERRTVSILFADLSGFTAVSERLDPERVKTMADRALRRLAEEIVRHGGSVDKFIGDNVMGVFGAPVAHEDDPERAVRAGLAMQAAMAEINERAIEVAEGGFELRVGINTGEVLAGRIGDGYTVIGDAVNVAARLQGAARPGSVLVGAATERSTRGAIEYRERGPLELKGKSRPVAAWEAVRAVVRGRAVRPARAGMPLIGRAEELSLLVSLYERVLHDGRPHLVTVLGQAGVGKSRLLRELAARLGERNPAPAIRLGSCPPYGAGLAYWALGEIVRASFEIFDSDDAETSWRKLSRGIEELAPESDSSEPPARLAAIVARALGIEPAAAPLAGAGEGEDPLAARERLFGAVRALVEAASRRQPLLLAVEDIHWADEGMLDLIEHLARWVGGPALIVCMSREELLDRRPGWGGGRLDATTIKLEPLGREETRELVGALLPAAGSALGPGAAGAEGASLIERVAERSGGNPLFAEEIVNRVFEEGGSDVEALPATVHSLLAARLDSLPRGERQLLQHAAVVGQAFWEGALIGPAAEEGLELRQALAALQERDLVVSSAGSRLAGEREYSFKHALIRDVAYSTLPKALRAAKHAEVAEFIATRAADRGEGAIAMVADHLGRAASLGEAADLAPAELERIQLGALEALEAAGDAAASLYSNREALAHFEAALALRRVLDPASRARLSEKLGDVALLLGRVADAIAGWEVAIEHHRREEDLPRVGDLHRKLGAGLWQKGDREGAIAHYQRGIDLLKDGPPCLELVRLYEEAASLYTHTGDNMLAIYASEKALRLAERLGEAGAASRAHGIFGRVFGRIGDAERARENLERSVELARESDPAEAIRALSALGYHFEVTEADRDGARRAYEEALAVAARIQDLPAEVELRASLAQLAALAGDWAAVEREADAANALVEREALAGKLSVALSARGILRWHEGRLEEAAELLHQAHEHAAQVGRSEVAFEALFRLAAVLRDRGDHADADGALARALDLCERAGLIAQSVEASAARAVNLALWGRDEAAAGAAAEAASLAERLRYPIGRAASLEARGAAAAGGSERERLLAEAADAWRELARPVDAARVERLAATLARG